MRAIHNRFSKRSESEMVGVFGQDGGKNSQAGIDERAKRKTEKQVIVSAGGKPEEDVARKMKRTSN